MAGFSSGKVYGPIAKINYYLWSGAYMVAGTTVESATPYPAQVLLFTHPSVILIAEMDSSGTFLFENLAPGEYLVLGIDRTRNRNARTYSYVTAVPM